MNFAKFLRTPFLTEHLWWLLLFKLEQKKAGDKGAMRKKLQEQSFAEILQNRCS